jgi:hypothetical protein
MTFRFVAQASVLFGLVGGLVLACSSAPSVEDYCGKLKARYDACPNGSNGSSQPVPATDGGVSTPTRPAFPESACTDNHRCLTALLETSVFNAYLDCASATDCTVSTSKCDESAFASGSHASDADVCAKKYAECKASGKTFDDDYCTSIRGVNSDILSKLNPCFEKPCDQIDACLDATTEAFAPGCELD